MQHKISKLNYSSFSQEFEILVKPRFFSLDDKCDLASEGVWIKSDNQVQFVFNNPHDD